ncbi:MAG: hypothetical protein H7836_04500 [Magnetococcus sp. YQC-3]
MPLTSLASFKNSRVSTRQATTSADVVPVPVSTGPANTLVAPVNTNRTYITLRNENTLAGDDMRYDYFDNPAILTQGFLIKAGEAVDLENQTAIYARAVVNAVQLSVDEGQG